MTTPTDNGAPKSNVQTDNKFNTDQFQLIDDDDDELLSSYVSNMEEKCTSGIDTVGTRKDAGSTVNNADLVSSNSFSATSSSSPCCESETQSPCSVTKRENKNTNNPLNFIDNPVVGSQVSRDLTDRASYQMGTDKTDITSPCAGQIDTCMTDMASTGTVESTKPTESSRVGVAINPTESSRVGVAINPTESPGVVIDPTENISPLEKFRPGYLWVSDLTRQHWCEQQLLYSFTVPGILVEDPVMTKGSDLHLQRELAVHDVVKVDITSSEDIWAVKMLNLLNSVQAFLHGLPLAREVPIFGAPFQEDVFMVGLIDELRFDLETYAIGLSELKTRLSRTKPSKSQTKQHRLQVMLYKKLFDDLVKGNITKDVIARHLRLKLTKELGEGVQGELGKSGLSCKTLDSLLDIVFSRMAAVTCIGETSVEYVHQESKQSFLHQDVVYDEEELKRLFRHYLGFWRGQREVEGVDIEDAWKCQRCDYESICEWREVKAAECARKNKLGRS